MITEWKSFWAWRVWHDPLDLFVCSFTDTAEVWKCFETFQEFTVGERLYMNVWGTKKQHRAERYETTVKVSRQHGQPPSVVSYRDLGACKKTNKQKKICFFSLICTSLQCYHVLWVEVDALILVRELGWLLAGTVSHSGGAGADWGGSGG